MDEKCYEALKAQNRLLKIILFVMFAMFVVAAMATFMVVPRVIDFINTAQNTLTQTQTVLSDLSKTAAQLSESDIAGLIQSSQDTINNLDIDSLNTALVDLKTVIEPMARFMGR